MRALTDRPLAFNLLVAFTLVAVGCVLESNAAYIMRVPEVVLFLPRAAGF